MATTYRGYEITKDDNGNYFWTDEEGYRHDASIASTGGGYLTEEDAMDNIDRHKRDMRNAQKVSA